MMRTFLFSVLLILSTVAHAGRHYTVGYNFEVAVDSLCAQTDDPLVNIDSICTYALPRGQQFVVARFQFVPANSAMWVQLATIDMEDSIMAQLVWVHEDKMLLSSVPDKAISKFIHAIQLRSDMVYKSALLLLVFLFMARYLQRHPSDSSQPANQRIYIMLLDNAGSFYPWLLAICTAFTTVAVLMTPSSAWLHYYFHPAINPMVVANSYVATSLAAMWATLVVAIATFTEVLRLLPEKKVWSYVCSIPCVCIMIVWLLGLICDFIA